MPVVNQVDCIKQFSRPKSLGMAPVGLLFFVHLGILWQGLVLCSSLSTKYVKLKDLEFNCDVSPKESLGDYITCARACTERPDCTFFEFTPSISSGDSWPRLGTCTSCPANNITGLTITPNNTQTETWVHIFGRIVDPQPETYISIPGALSVGRLLVIKGRIPVPAPERVIVDIYHNNKDDIPVRVTPRFNYKDMVKRLIVANRRSGNWAVTVLPQSTFPFYEGKDFEIRLLTTVRGFMVYVNEDFIRTNVKPIYMTNDIGYFRFEDADIHTVSY
ncbi:hypothetical protein EGW08_000872 [Elysia chlorotica]|uniref:Galectin n=1 Tax=Elysia chlorotica TaxID=188477 RepID=A0A433UBX5_ELYCH|nr:hypothetical protein EGW08_000872 [Elysia chlorotica]